MKKEVVSSGRVTIAVPPLRAIDKEQQQIETLFATMALAYLCTPGEFVMLVSSMGSSASDGDLVSIQGVRKGKIEVVSLFDGRYLLVGHEDFIDSNEEGEDDEIEIDDDFAEDDIDIDAFHSKRQKRIEPIRNERRFTDDHSQPNAINISNPDKKCRSAMNEMQHLLFCQNASLQKGASNTKRKLNNLTNFLQNSPKKACAWMELAKLKSEESDHAGVFEALYRACVHCPLSRNDESNSMNTMNMYIKASQLLLDFSRMEVLLLKIRCLIRAINIARSSYDINFIKFKQPTKDMPPSSSSSSCTDYVHLSEDIGSVLALSFHELGRTLLALENLCGSQGKASSYLKGAAVAFLLCTRIDQQQTLEYSESNSHCLARLTDQT